MPLTCVTKCSCDNGYIRDAVYDEDTNTSIPKDSICPKCQGGQCYGCHYGVGCAD